MDAEICAIGTRTRNSQLMLDCHRLGYLSGRVLDCTYGLGRFWSYYRPPNLVTMDIQHGYADCVADFTAFPLVDGTFDTVVFDPPYKLNGTPTHNLDMDYGAGTRATIRDRMELIYLGLLECFRVSRRYVLVKCQDMISSGRYQPQTFTVWQWALECDGVLVDCLHVIGRRPQPMNTRQLHARRDYSTLLVFAVSKRYEIRTDIPWSREETHGY